MHFAAIFVMGFSRRPCWRTETALHENRSYFPGERNVLFLHGGNDVTWKCSMEGFHGGHVGRLKQWNSFAGERKFIVFALQHGGIDVTRKSSVRTSDSLQKKNYWRQLLASKHSGRCSQMTSSCNVLFFTIKKTTRMYSLKISSCHIFRFRPTVQDLELLV